MLKIYGHPWSINTRKTLMTLVEKGQPAELVLVMLPKGEHKLPEHVERHPFGKVPVLDHDGLVLYETQAINQYLERVLPGTRLMPAEAHEAARMDQWIRVADAYFAPHAHALIVEGLFRRYLGGAQNVALMDASREAMQPALDVIDRWLSANAHLAGAAFSLADVYWMPYFEYLDRIGEGDHLRKRKHADAWWRRVSQRPSWHEVARRGPQPYEPDMTADVVERQFRRQPSPAARV